MATIKTCLFIASIVEVVLRLTWTNNVGALSRFILLAFPHSQLLGFLAAKGSQAPHTVEDCPQMWELSFLGLHPHPRAALTQWLTQENRSLPSYLKMKQLVRCSPVPGSSCDLAEARTQLLSCPWWARSSSLSCFIIPFSQELFLSTSGDHTSLLGICF